MRGGCYADRGVGFFSSKCSGAEVHSHHASPLISPCGQFSVEVHTRLSGQGGPTPEAMRARAYLVAHGLRVPSPTDRLAHTIAHAQLHNRQAVTRRLVLKDILDIQVLGAGLTIHARLLDRLFASPRERWAGWSLRRRRSGRRRTSLRRRGSGPGRMARWRDCTGRHGGRGWHCQVIRCASRRSAWRTRTVI